MRLNVGLHYSTKSISTSNNDYLSYRENQEKEIFTPNFNLLYSHYINEKTSVTSGISFNQFGEKTGYNILNTFSKDTTLSLLSDSARILSWDSVNHVVYVTYDTYLVDTTFIDSNYLINQFKNLHSYLTIPLLIGCEFKLKKWTINLKAGIGMSFLVKNKAKYINYELSNFISPTPKKIILNYLISPTIGYQINSNIGLELNPQIIINNSSLIHYKNVQQVYTNFGINFGINYTFSQPKL